MDDLISRQAAIDALKNMCSEDEDGITVSRANVDSMLQALPSAQPERKKGKWITQDFNKRNESICTAVYYFPKCSICGASAPVSNFCPNCGADMRVEQQQNFLPCENCQHRDKDWYEEPCDSCTFGKRENHFEPWGGEDHEQAD